jgi:predicted GIY-YIG superfamily endonuclease/proteasome lid subunit RPN8/RPN11
MVFWAYMLHCRAGRFYTGHTDDLERRMAEHQIGLVPGYTKARHPLALVWSQDFPSRYEAISAERQIKGWSRAKKLALIRGDWDLISRLAKKKSGPSTSSGRTELAVRESALQFLRSESGKANPLEACGILFGEGRLERAAVTANVHPEPLRHFEIDPAALIAAHKAERAGGPRIAGYWHSHPSGEDAPSATDRTEAAGDGKIWAIVAGEIVTFWRDLPGGFEALPYRRVAD